LSFLAVTESTIATQNFTFLSETQCARRPTDFAYDFVDIVVYVD